jgi:D-glycero-alpha-D-manno-heptose-7-phosphate kinase
MIISRTPYRISFFGGGTDYPAWYMNHGGAVLATTINKYCYISCRYLPPYFDHRIRVVYSKIESCQSLEEIAHPAVREVLRFLNFSRGLEIHHDGDLPARSGMGSSSSFTIGLLHALHALQSHMVSKHQLAKEGIHVEQNCLKETVGSQDQVLAAYGGLNHVRFFPSGDINVQPLTLSPERAAELNQNLMLIYTGIKRTASDVASTFVPTMDARRRQLRIMMDLVGDGLSILGGNGDLMPFGKLLHEAWMEKRSFSNRVACKEVDEMYDCALGAGAIGGKLLGAGGGGFLLLFVPLEHQARVRERLTNLIHVPFKFEMGGSQIIFFEPEEDYSAQEIARRAQDVVFRELDMQPEHDCHTVGTGMKTLVSSASAPV